MTYFRLSRRDNPGDTPQSGTDRADILRTLKGHIARFEGACTGSASGPVMPLGHAPIDDVLPGGGLVWGGIHEILAKGYGDLPASFGFGAALATRFMEYRHAGCVPWCSDRSVQFDFGSLYGPGIAAFGLDPSRLVLVDTAKVHDLLWALEQSVRLPGLAAVVGLMGNAPAYDLTASRRLQLASAQSGVPLLLLRGHGEGDMTASAAATRWRIAAHNFRGGSAVGSAAWTVWLEKARGVAPRQWQVVWDASLKRFRPVDQAHVPSRRGRRVRISGTTADAGNGLLAVG